MNDAAEDPDALVPAVFARTDFEARTKAAILEDEGIDAVVNTAERGWFGASQPVFSGKGIGIFVRRRDAERARNALEKRIEDSIDLDWEAVDVGEPLIDAATERLRGRHFFFTVIAIIIAVIIVLRMVL